MLDLLLLTLVESIVFLLLIASFLIFRFANNAKLLMASVFCFTVGVPFIIAHLLGLHPSFCIQTCGVFGSGYLAQWTDLSAGIYLVSSGIIVAMGFFFLTISMRNKLKSTLN